MFQKANAVWMAPEEGELLNCHLIFKETLPSLKGAVLSVAGADFYRLTVNGQFVGFGPARCAKGYARVDRHDLTEYDRADGENEILIEAAGYRCGSLSTVQQPSFLIAEVVVNGEAVRYTGRDFPAYRNTSRVQKVERYAAQRHFQEMYVEGTDLFAEENRVKTVAAGEGIRFLPRRVPKPFYEIRQPKGMESRGTFVPHEGEALAKCRKRAYSFPPENKPGFGWFPEEEIASKTFRWVESQNPTKTADGGTLPLRLTAGEWCMMDFGRIEVGFLGIAGTAHTDTDLVLGFTEYCGDTFAATAMNAHTVMEYHIPAGGTLNRESFEPYSFRKAAVYVKSGEFTFQSLWMRSFERDMRGVIPRSFRDSAMQEIYEASLRTFAHNAVDLFTDCPSRERAGWLCDTFFTARAEQYFFGDTPIEDAFLENYLLYENEGEFPEGVLPMCYPSDPHENFRFIPQWDMWYIMEVCEYLSVRHPDRDREIWKKSVFGILDFLRRHENGDGLLEKLPSWNFVEWSKANTWVQDVNYPTNFLYAALLCSVADTFGMPELKDKAAAIRRVLLDRAFDGTVFLDHAVYDENGVLVNQKHASEACQYYALLFGDFDWNEPRYEKLMANVWSSFADFPEKEPDYEYCPVNAFIGLYMRLMFLQKLGDSKLMRDNLAGFFGGMCEKTGTLWEYRDANRGSKDHGFASFAACCLELADQ